MGTEKRASPEPADLNESSWLSHFPVKFEFEFEPRLHSFLAPTCGLRLTTRKSYVCTTLGWLIVVEIAPSIRAARRPLASASTLLVDDLVSEQPSKSSPCSRT